MPLILVSGSISEEEAVAALRGGARDFLTKGKLARLAPAIERELREAGVREERRKAEKRIRFQAEILSQMHEAVLVSDLDGAVTYWNHVAESLYGLTASQAFGRPLEQIVSCRMPPAQREARRAGPERTGLLAGRMPADHALRQGGVRRPIPEPAGRRAWTASSQAPRGAGRHPAA